MNASAKQRQALSPCSLIGLWDVVGSTIVTTTGCYVRGLKVRGLDSLHAREEELQFSAEHLYRELASHWPEHSFAQVIMRSHGDYSDIFEAFEQAPQPDHPILRLQREKRLEFMRASNLRRHSVEVYFGSYKGMSSKEFSQVSIKSHRAKLEEISSFEPMVTETLKGAGLEVQQMTEQELLERFWRQLNPDLGSEQMRPYTRRQELLSRRVLKKYPRLRVQTIREYLMQSEWEWDEDHVRVGSTYCRVLTLRDLPARTIYTLAEAFYGVRFDFTVSASLMIPSQAKLKSQLNQQRRFAKSLSGDSGNIADYEGQRKHRESEQLAEAIAETGQRLLLVCLQLVVTGNSKKQLDKRTRELTDRLRAKDLGFFEEKAAHDLEFAKTLPGMALHSKRHLLMTSNNAVDLLPIFEEDHGDRDPVLLVKTDRDELFSFNPFERARDNWNGTVFGASGAGKSVFMNMLIDSAILSNSTRGKLMVVDFAGETKSSYLMMAKLFGGTFIPVVTSDSTAKKFAMNPFPDAAQAVDEDGQVHGWVESFLTLMTDILLSNSGSDKDAQLFRGIVRKAIRETYKRLDGRTPIYSDLLATLKTFRKRPDVQPERLDVIVELLRGFLESPSSELFNRQSSSTPDSEFLVVDLFGIDSLEPQIAEALAFLTCHWVKQVAFDPKNQGYKYIVLDEVAQLIRRQEMLGLIGELFSTGRKHLCSTWTITQSYGTFRQSELAGTIKLNSTTQIFLSHASDSQGRDDIAQDYAFSGREKALFERLKTVKGKYSSALIRTVVKGAKGSEKDQQHISSVFRLELSPLDYEICTSDQGDRNLQAKYIEANPDKPLHEVLLHVARKKQQEGRL